MTAGPPFATIPQIVAASEATLPNDVWEFLIGGAGVEWTVRRNRAALDEIAFNPRVLVDVRTRRLATTLLGHPLRIPVFGAPMGSIARFHPGGALAAARAAARFPTLCFVSVNAEPEIGQVVGGSEAAVVYQIYGYDDHDHTTALVRRAEDVGCVGVCITANSAVYGRRERDVRNGFYSTEEGREATPRAGFTWRDLEWLRALTPLPLVLKGVLCPEDAALAVECGVDVVYVSNLGGRRLDYAPATIDVLADVVGAVGERVPVVVDSGFERGFDVVKALALGATAVGVGRLQAHGLAADGEAGLLRAFELLEEELSQTLALLGVIDVDALSPANLRRVG